MECKVKNVITLGDQGGAGHLNICEVVPIHINEDIITDRNRIDPDKTDLMGRAYARLSRHPWVCTFVQCRISYVVKKSRLHFRVKYP